MQTKDEKVSFVCFFYAGQWGGGEGSGRHTCTCYVMDYAVLFPLNHTSQHDYGWFYKIAFSGYNSCLEQISFLGMVVVISC